MKKYMVDFLDDFEFCQQAKEQLLKDYDRVISSEKQNAFFNCITAYETGEISYDDGIQSIQEIAKTLNINVYSLALIYLIFLTKSLKIRYQEQGISEETWRETVADLKYKALDCEGLYGVWGVNAFSWHKGFFELTKFGFGKLQFQLTNFNNEYAKNGLSLQKDSRVVYVHVPRTGGKLDYDEVQISYQKAKAFFKSRFADIFETQPLVFVFRSWMLFEKHKDILAEQSNFMRFCNDYDVFERGEYEDYSNAWRVFYCPYDGDISKLPQNTSLQKAYAEIIQKGEKLGWGWGVYCPEF